MKARTYIHAAIASLLLISAAHAGTTYSNSNKTKTTVTTVDGITTTVVATRPHSNSNDWTVISTTTSSETKSISKGELAVSAFVRKDVKPVISWDLTEKITLQELISNNNGSITALVDLDVTVTVLGTGVTSGSGSNYTSYVTRGYLKIGDGSWNQVHYGNEDAVIPGKVTFTGSAKKGDSFRFAAAYKSGDNWKDYRYENSSEILTLTNGQRIPSNKPDNDAVASAEDFLKPHMNSNGTLKLGELDFIYVAELTHTRTSDSGYDLQDLIVHVSVAPSAN